MEHVSKVLVVSHCLLNKGTRWWQDGKSLERNIGLASEILEFVLRHKIGVIQMPCPEYTFCGNPRPSRTKDEYERLLGFKEYCERLAKIVTEQLKNLVDMGKKPRIQILAVVGIKRSPSCAVNSAVRKIDDQIEYIGEKGIFLQFLEREMLKAGLSVPFLEFDFDNPFEAIEKLNMIVQN
ncbi:MAG: hypothetical protein QXK89_05100 [Candidatus Bathyarchaeia archaeon]|nr:hypothetical protein [Candidatus Bathyarchaeota archaeon]